MRARVLILAALFVLVPILEIYVIIQVGQVIGPWWTILLLIGAGILGSVLVKSEGRRAWTALNQALSEHRMPAKELADGALILIGGTLLLTPGFATDLVGVFVILPITRPLARAALSRAIARRITLMPTGRPGTHDRPGPDVVRGDVVD